MEHRTTAEEHLPAEDQRFLLAKPIVLQLLRLIGTDDPQGLRDMRSLRDEIRATMGRQTPVPMPVPCVVGDYRVRWEIDVEADGPSDAACQARLHATREDTAATVFDVFRRVAESGGIDDGPIFELVQSFDVRYAPSFPHFRALTIEEGEAEDEAE